MICKQVSNMTFENIVFNEKGENGSHKLSGEHTTASVDPLAKFSFSLVPLHLYVDPQP